MALLCVITGLLQLVTLLAVTGALVSVAAVSRMMEVTIAFIHPTSMFFLQQSNKLVLCGINLTVGLTVSVFREMCPRPPVDGDQYSRSALDQDRASTGQASRDQSRPFVDRSATDQVTIAEEAETAN